MARGVGTIIKETLAAWYITSNPGCYCEDIAAELDRTNIHRIEERFSEFASKIEESVKSWRSGLKKIVPQPPRYVVEELLSYGIRKHKEEVGLPT